MQIKIKNLSVNKIFLEKVLFHSSTPQVMKVVDLNIQKGDSKAKDQDLSIFNDSIVFNPGEIRQYLFMVAHQ